MQNQIRWFCRIQEFEEPNEWTFVIVNTRKRELDIRGSKILTELCPIEDYKGPIHGNVKRVYYKIMRFLSHSPPNNEILDRTYKGKKTEDRKLGEVTNEGSLEAYVRRAIEINKF